MYIYIYKTNFTHEFIEEYCAKSFFLFTIKLHKRKKYIILKTNIFSTSRLYKKKKEVSDKMFEKSIIHSYTFFYENCPVLEKEHASLSWEPLCQ